MRDEVEEVHRLLAQVAGALSGALVRRRITKSLLQESAVKVERALKILLTLA